MMLIIRWLSAHEIKVVHQYRPKKATALKKYHIVRQASGPLIHVYKNAANEFLLYKGIDAFNTLSVLYPQKKVPCIINPYDIPRLDWYDEFLIMCNKENVYYKVREEIIRLILKHSHSDVKKVADLLGSSEDEFHLNYMINKKVSNKDKRSIDEKGRTKLVNTIFNEPLFIPYKQLLLYLATQDKNRLTYEKMKYFKWYLNSGYTINTKNSSLNKQIDEFRKVVNLKKAWQTYWLYLKED